MNTIVKSLGCYDKKKNIVFVIANILNLTVIGVFSTLITELLKIRDRTLEVSKDENISMYFIALIVISGVIILFSLWIISIIQNTIFVSRKSFNIQLKMAGVVPSDLFKIYFLENCSLQMRAIPIGIVLAELAYHFISIYNEIETQWINAGLLLFSVVIHCATIMLCMLRLLNEIKKFNPIEELRDPYKSNAIRSFRTMDIVKFIIGVVCIVLTFLNVLDENTGKMLAMVGVFLVLDMVFVSLQYFLVFIGKKFRHPVVILTHQNILGNYKKIDPIITTLVVGVMLSIGLNGMFNLVRKISSDTVMQNVYFDYLVINDDAEYRDENYYKEMLNNMDSNVLISYAINVEMKDSEGYNNTISAIDSSYLANGEKFVLTDGSDPTENLNSATFNGIYLPQYFISDASVGKDYVLDLNGNKITFKIAGRFIANGSRGRYGFVSKKYLQSIFGKDIVNAFYLRNVSSSLLEAMKNDKGITSQIVISKKDIASNSYENAVNGTEIFEISSIAVILISLLMVVYYVFSVSQKNIFDICRLRAMGVSKKHCVMVYVNQFVSIALQSFAVGVILSYLLISIGINMMLQYIDVPVEITLPYVYIVCSYLIFTLICVFTSVFSVRKGLKKDITMYIGNNS